MGKRLNSVGTGKVVWCHQQRGPIPTSGGGHELIWTRVASTNGSGLIGGRTVRSDVK